MEWLSFCVLFFIYVGMNSCEIPSCQGLKNLLVEVLAKAREKMFHSQNEKSVENGNKYHLEPGGFLLGDF